MLIGYSENTQRHTDGYRLVPQPCPCAIRQSDRLTARGVSSFVCNALINDESCYGLIYGDYNSIDRTTVVESTNEKGNWINPATVPACELLQLGRDTTVRELSGVRENPRLSLPRIYERARKTSVFGELPVARGSPTPCKNLSNARVYRPANFRASKFGEPACRCSENFCLRTLSLARG